MFKILDNQLHFLKITIKAALHLICKANLKLFDTSIHDSYRSEIS